MKRLSLIFLFLIACAPLHIVSPPRFVIRPVEKEPQVWQAKFLGKFRITFYWIVREEDYRGRRTVPLYTVDGKLLSYFPYSFVRDFKIESCARLRDGRLISWLKKQKRVKVVDQPLGKGFSLMPLKSVAVDPQVIPLGSKVFIPKACGIKTEEKTLNGVFYTHDIGEKIVGKSLDIFLGEKENIKYFLSGGIGSGQKVEVYLLE